MGTPICRCCDLRFRNPTSFLGARERTEEQVGWARILARGTALASRVGGERVRCAAVYSHFSHIIMFVDVIENSRDKGKCLSLLDLSVVAGARYVPFHIRAAFWQRFASAA